MRSSFEKLVNIMTKWRSMPELDVTVSMLKCPICDSNHNYIVKIEYEESSGKNLEDSSICYNTFTTKKKVGDDIQEVRVFEIDAFCQKNRIPFRIIVDPSLPPGAVPTKITVNATT